MRSSTVFVSVAVALSLTGRCAIAIAQQSDTPPQQSETTNTGAQQEGSSTSAKAAPATTQTPAPSPAREATPPNAQTVQPKAEPKKATPPEPVPPTQPSPQNQGPGVHPELAGGSLTPDADAKIDSKTKKHPRPSTTISVEGMLGASGRLGSMSSGYDSTDRGGLLYGGGVFYAPDRRFALGASYQRGIIGSEEFGPGQNDNTGKISRTLQSASIAGRVYPFRNDTIGFWGGLSAGIVWQTASATGSYVTGQMAVAPRTYKTDAGPNAGLALGLAAGFDYDVDDMVGVLGSLNLNNYRLTSDPLSNSDGLNIPGAGTTTEVSARFAVQIRFDLQRNTSTQPSTQTGMR